MDLCSRDGIWWVRADPNHTSLLSHSVLKSWNTFITEAFFSFFFFFNDRKKVRLGWLAVVMDHELLRQKSRRTINKKARSSICRSRAAWYVPVEVPSSWIHSLPGSPEEAGGGWRPPKCGSFPWLYDSEGSSGAVGSSSPEQPVTPALLLPLYIVDMRTVYIVRQSFCPVELGCGCKQSGLDMLSKGEQQNCHGYLYHVLNSHVHFMPHHALLSHNLTFLYIEKVEVHFLEKTKKKKKKSRIAACWSADSQGK